MIDVFLGLGSNANSASDFLSAALKLLAALHGCKLLSVSSVYITEPQDLRNQPWFSNQAVKMNVAGTSSPEKLLQSAMSIERELGRVRSGPRYGPRVIDIDILLYGNLVSANPFCLLPHPRLVKRAFALVPLIEIEPEIHIMGVSAKTWLSRLNWHRDGNKIFQ